jgi:hypothetical protein
LSDVRGGLRLREGTWLRVVEKALGGEGGGVTAVGRGKVVLLGGGESGGGGGGTCMSGLEEPLLGLLLFITEVEKLI